MSQHAATRRNRVAKRTQHVAPSNVAICYVEKLRSYDRSFINVAFFKFLRRSMNGVLNSKLYMDFERTKFFKWLFQKLKMSLGLSIVGVTQFCVVLFRLFVF